MAKRTPHLETVELNRFKAAFEPEPIPLRPFTVIVGRNGSGKSTLIEALQWLDTTARRSASEACDRYRGIADLINKRAKDRFFEIGLTFKDWAARDRPLYYEVRVGERNGASNPRPVPVIASEHLTEGLGPEALRLVDTAEKARRVFARSSSEPILFDGSERLAWTLGSKADPAFRFLQDFWSRAVFLRLSPSQLAKDSPATRGGLAPLLDEEGKMLPALLLELDRDQRAELVEMLAAALPDVEGLDIREPDLASEVHYSLLEKMPKAGRTGRAQIQIPAWMLSEGTRRLTAIFALLVHDPPPSLLCIEEIENGLDPWTVIKVLGHLEAASRRGTQVVVTTHSVWLLDECPLDSILHVERQEGQTRYQRFLDREGIRTFKASIPAGTRYVNEPR